MDDILQINDQLLEKLVFPLILALIGWLLKDFLFAVYARREEVVRKEWERRLLEVWSPLYYWSGIVLLEGKQSGWDRHGLNDLEKVLARSAHLIPIGHYNTLIKLIQGLTHQRAAPPALADIQKTRQFIYNQIKTFNYLLYRRNGWFEATTYTDALATGKYFLRFVSQAFRHMVVWVAIVVLVGGTYLAFAAERYWAVFIVIAVLSVPILYDWFRQIKLHRKLHEQTKG